MICNSIRSEIALWVGNDLEEGEALRVERHLAHCPHCREFAQNLKSALEPLHEPVAVDPGPSLWPRIAARIAAIDNARPLVRFHGWLPAAAAIAASIAIITLLELRQPVPPAAPEFAPQLASPDTASRDPQLFAPAQLHWASAPAVPDPLSTVPPGDWQNRVEQEGWLSQPRLYFPQ